LIHGCRNAAELNYGNLIKELSNRHRDQFQFIAAHSRENKHGMLHGRLTTLLSNGILENMTDRTINVDDSHVMLCGSDSMISDMRQLLEARGLQRHTPRQQGHYTTEKYH
jgi:ferredoxin--NADP+ reductase